MSWNSLSAFVDHLESIGELIRVATPVETRLEITEIADRMVKNNGPALLFENNGTQFPLLINAFASDARITAALGVQSLKDIPDSLEHLVSEMARMKGAGWKGKMSVFPRMVAASKWLPRKSRRRGACQEVVMPVPDLKSLPVLHCWPHDGGPFITLPLVHTVDPETGQTNTGMYRIQVFDGVNAGMHWHLHKDGASHFAKHQKAGTRMPVTVTLGGDPLLTYAATAPLPPFLDEFLFAGIIRKKGVRLAKSLTNNIWIPADADIVIEGYIDPKEQLRMEGPFGDHTGFYSLPDLYPVFHVTTITHKRKAVYPTTIVGIPPMEDLWLGRATERIFLMPVRQTVAPEIIDMHMPAEGVFHNIVTLSMRSCYPGQAQKVAGALWGAGQMMFNKVMLICPGKTLLHQYPAFLETIAGSVDPGSDIFFSKGPLDVLDHSGRGFAFGSKMGVDATMNRQLPLPKKPNEGVMAQLLSIPGVVGASLSPVEVFFPMMILFVDKQKGISVADIHAAAAPLVSSYHLRFIACFDLEAEGLSLSDLLWLASGNIDPERDTHFVVTRQSKVACFDATRKIRGLDEGFDRDWPNLTVMNKETIALVDKKWNQYQLGDPLVSPSIRFIPYLKGDGAAVTEE